MATLKEYRNQDGKLVSFQIRVFCGRDAKGKDIRKRIVFEVQPSWSEKTAYKKAVDFAAIKEKEYKEGLAADNRQKFEPYCEYVLSLKEERGIKHSTITRYKELAARVYPAIGHLKLRDIRADHLNSLYTALGKEGQNKRGGKLSNKTILEHHRLIHTVLEQAMREGLIPVNPADRVTLPKAEHKEVNYFQPEQVHAIREALEAEPIKWKTLTHLLLITGARRGEILGLKWNCVDFERKQIYICNNVLYTPEKGIYEDTPKTERSKRYITLPDETIALLKRYHTWQLEERLRLGGYYQDKGFVFAQDNGSPIHPDSVTDWLNKFSKRHDLPHINPHAFRHTMASMLYFNGIDSVSISKRLGHAQVSTTANIYAHVLEEADKRNADILSQIYFEKHGS